MEYNFDMNRISFAIIFVGCWLVMAMLLRSTASVKKSICLFPLLISVISLVLFITFYIKKIELDLSSNVLCRGSWRDSTSVLLVPCFGGSMINYL